MLRFQLIFILLVCAGCASTRQDGQRTVSSQQVPNRPVANRPLLQLGTVVQSRRGSVDNAVRLVAHEADSEQDPGSESAQSADSDIEAFNNRTAVATGDDAKLDLDAAEGEGPPSALVMFNLDTLSELESIAVTQNPVLLRIGREYEAAAAKSDYVDALPDPTIAGNLFIAPIETAAGSQRANLTFSQKIPSLARLDAQARKACLEAMAIQQVYASERLKIVGDLRAKWFQLYVVGKQIEITTKNQALLESLIEVATARVETGDATQGDVLSATVEYSKLEERLVSLRQQRVSFVAGINQLLGRNADTPIEAVGELALTMPKWSHAMLREVAWEQQPDIVAAPVARQPVGRRPGGCRRSRLPARCSAEGLG